MNGPDSQLQRQPNGTLESGARENAEDQPSLIFVGLEIGGTNLKAGVLRGGAVLGEHRSEEIPGGDSAREPEVQIYVLDSRSLSLRAVC